MAIWNIGIRGRLWNIISSLYDNVKGQVRFGDIETQSFDIEEGVKQGCVLSPTLFCIIMNELTKLLREHALGVRIHDICLGSLFWADDIVLLADSEKELNKMLDLVSLFAKKWKFNFNSEKSNVLIIGQNLNSEKLWKLGDTFISEVETYKYLGVYISRNLKDNFHINQVIKKGNRIIAYIKSIIDRLNNFDRVVYGDILWRSIGLPTINYACAVCVNTNTKDIQRIESLQLQMARTILKASRSTAKEALYGDLGWQPIKVTQDIFKAKYIRNVMCMEMYRWPKLILNTIIRHKNFNSRYQFINEFEKTCDYIKFDFNAILNDICTGTDIDINWVKPFENTIKQSYSTFWKQEVLRKSSLLDYSLIKESPSLEPYLLDKTDFYGSSLKFKLRINTLPLGKITNKWNIDNLNDKCKVCGSGEEDVKHFLFICNKLHCIRMEELQTLQHKLIAINCVDTWVNFISGDLSIKVQYVLGSTLFHKNNSHDIYAVFDSYCKMYTSRAWKLRNAIVLQI
ncbi:uncharacterized protein [Antedon mediterranea]|uniref:uncharacterized protein n=1 Tax=Antedon mediterranea TaxID=105859 RepID=UPI003AF6EE2C